MWEPPHVLLKGQNFMKNIRITSISFSKKPDESVWKAVESAGRIGSDLIVLPETWAGEQEIELLDSPRVCNLQKLAAQYKTYIVSGMYRKTEKTGRINSAILIGRSGEIEGIYDKVYPYWEEFKLNPPVEIGKEPIVFETDFGKLGIAICFDVNIPSLWHKMAELGAELVVWPSAYSAGTSLMAHAINHNYYIVTSTLEYDCTVFDITGRKILYNKSIIGDDILISSIVLDLDRCIFHMNYNERVQELLANHSHEIIQETSLIKEQWFVLKSVNESVSVRDLARKYGLTELRDYKLKMCREIDKMRMSTSTK